MLAVFVAGNYFLIVYAISFFYCFNFVVPQILKNVVGEILS